jgi:cell division protein FtsN
MEVVVPEDELANDRPPALPPPPPPKPAETARHREPSPPPPAASPAPRAEQPAEAQPKDGSSYLLQVASFKSPADAERLKARLALLGVSSSIQQVTINGKDTYHRVRAGPYRGKEALDEVRALLTRNGLESMAVKLK